MIHLFQHWQCPLITIMGYFSIIYTTHIWNGPGLPCRLVFPHVDNYLPARPRSANCWSEQHALSLSIRHAKDWSSFTMKVSPQFLFKTRACMMVLLGASSHHITVKAFTPVGDPHMPADQSLCVICVIKYYLTMRRAWSSDCYLCDPPSFYSSRYSRNIDISYSWVCFLPWWYGTSALYYSPILDRIRSAIYQSSGGNM